MTDQTADLRNVIAEALMSWAERNGNPQYASLRRPETVRQNAYGRADAVLKALTAAGVRAVQPDACTCGHPRERHITCCTECFCIKFVQAGPRRAAAGIRVAARQAAGQPAAAGPRCTCGDTPCESDLCDCDDYDCPACTPAVGGQDATPPAEAQPAQEQWRTAYLDGAGLWTLFGPTYHARAAAEAKVAELNASRPTWANGNPVERRTVRETTTWTVEEDA